MLDKCLTARLRALLLQRKKKQTRQKTMEKLFNPLLPLLQAQQPSIALTPLVLRAYQRTHDGVVRHFCEAGLVGFDLVGEAVELRPVDLCIVSI